MLKLKFAWIVLCFVVTAASRLRCHNKRDWALLTVGMAFTLVADFFLVLHDNQPIGVAVFCFVHVAYFYRVSPRRYRWIPLVVAAVVIVVAATTATNFIIAVAAMYAGLFVMDIAACVCNYRRDWNGLPPFNRALILAGVLLFALCDVNVWLFNLPSYVALSPPLLNRLSQIGYALIWVFYAPAQLLLAVSALRFPPLPPPFDSFSFLRSCRPVDSTK